MKERREISWLKGIYANTEGFIEIITTDGFERVPTNKVGNGYKVATLIAKTFPEICGEWFDGCEVDHLNTIRTDDRAENLRVCTHAQNQNNPLTRKHLAENYLNKGKNKKEPPRDTIAMYSLNMEFIRSFKNIMQASKQTGIGRASIYRCCNAQQKWAGKPKGEKYIFKWMINYPRFSNTF